MKKSLILFSSLVLAGVTMTAMGTNVSAAEAPVVPIIESKTRTLPTNQFSVDDKLIYQISATGNEVSIVNHYLNSLPENVVIPAKVTNAGTEYTVTEIGAASLSLAEGEQDLVKIVTIPATVKKISNSAFVDRAKLETVNISGNGLVEIEANVFKGNESLTTINIPTGVTTIGSDAFSNTSSLKKITIPDTVVALGQRVFLGATSLESITLSSKLEAIPRSAFEGCVSLKTISLPDSVLKISSYAFKGTGITEIKLPTGVTETGGLFEGTFFGANINKMIFTTKFSKSLDFTKIIEQPTREGYIFDGWTILKPDGTEEKVTHELLYKASLLGNATATAQWKADATAPSSDKSNATIRLVQPTGSISFGGNVTTDAKMAFSEVTLNGKEQTVQETTNAKIAVNDSRADKSNGWSVKVKFDDTIFSSKGIDLSLKPKLGSLAETGPISITGTEQKVIGNQTLTNANYEILLQPSLKIPSSLTEANTYQTKLVWTLEPSV